MTRSSPDLPPVAETGEWLAGSGIQNAGADPKLRGGVAAWYEIYKRLYPFLYSEITGYAITAFVFLNRLRPDPRWLDRAELAARWLVRNAFRLSPGVRTRYYLVRGYVTPNYAFHAGRVYAFDTAMVAYGLLQLHRERPNPVYRDHADKAWDFITGTLRRKDGNFYPYYDTVKDAPGEDADKWSDQTGGFQAKLALFFIDYYVATRKRAAREAARRLLDGVLGLQEKDGRFVTSRKDGSTHLHPHFYTVEGLLYGGVALGNRAYLESAGRAFAWAERAVSEDGSVSALYERHGFVFHERSDIVAQALRAGSALWALGIGRAPRRARLLEKIRDHLKLFQFLEKGSQRGGFLYGADTDGRLRIHLNAWASMFAMQALWMHEEFVVKSKPLDMDHFI